MSLSPVYQIVLKDKTGTQVAIIDDYRSLQAQKIVNDLGFFTLILGDTDPKRDLFEKDGQVEIKRRIPGYTDWYTEFECVILDFTTVLYENGNTQFTAVGAGYNEIASRRRIAYKKDTVRSKKNDVTETVMKEYVRENLGSDATVANGRLYDGVVTGFSIETDLGQGVIWGGERSGENLLDTLKKIALYSGVDFNIVGTGVGTYEFRTYASGIGDDRTTVGLDTTTGLNAAGNAPHIFSVGFGNVETLVLSDKSKDTASLVYALGQGAGASQLIEYAVDLTAIADSPFGAREVVRGGGSQATAAELQYMAEETLTEMLARPTISFKPLNIPASLYGVHFFWGDKVTIRFRDTDYNKRITGVRTNVSSAGESLEFTFSDIE